MAGPGGAWQGQARLGCSIYDFLLGLGLATAYWPGFLSAATAPRWCLLALAAPLLLWQVPSLSFSGLTFPLTAFLSYALLSLWWTPVPIIGLWPIAHFAIFAALIIYAAQADTDGLLIGFAIGIALQAPLVIAQAHGFDLIGQSVPPAGLFYNRNFLAEAAVPVLIWLCYRPNLAARMIAVGVAIDACLSFDRAAAVGAAVGLWFVLGRRSRIVLATLAFAVIAELTLISAWGEQSIAGRLLIWGAIISHMSWFGAGASASTVMLYPLAHAVHSDPLQLLYELGLGAIPLFWVIGNAFQSDGPERPALACLVAESMFSLPFQLPATIFLAALLIGRLHARRECLRPLGHLCGVHDLAYRRWPPAPRRYADWGRQ